MPLSLSSRADFTLANFQRVAWQGDSAGFAKSALRRMEQTRRQFLALLDSDPEITIYGVTSGYGQMASKRLSPAERKKHARTPPHGSLVAFGIALPERVARGIVFARLANYVEGHAAISPELAAAVAGLLDGRKLPEVSLEGQGGAGEILGLAPLFNGLAERFELGEKECLALINGSPCASALLADSALAATAPAGTGGGGLRPFLRGDPRPARAFRRRSWRASGATRPKARRSSACAGSWRAAPRSAGHIRRR